MQTELLRHLSANYRSASQRARVATEDWAHRNLYCPNCDSARLDRAPNNTAAVDYFCPRCRAPFQLKAQSQPLSKRIVDAAYETMVKAIRSDRTPNLFIMQYSAVEWIVLNVIVVPHFAFPLSAVEKRKPLALTARRAGWVGCNIRLDAIPVDAKIQIVEAGIPVDPARVRRKYARVEPLARLDPVRRGWTLDVLNAVRSLQLDTFSLADVYAKEAILSAAHPKNRHVREKIRQQLQVLRDVGIIEFIGDGRYQVRATGPDREGDSSAEARHFH